MSNTVKLIISIVTCLAAGFIGSYFTADAIPTWYAELRKPSLNPPNWVFGPVWTALYILMGLSLFMVWKEGTGNSLVRPALAIFSVQLLLNLLWSMVFFGMRSISGGLVIIVLLWIAILLTIWKFTGVSRTAAYLLIPYLLWVTFASYLNFSFYQLNK